MSTLTDTLAEALERLASGLRLNEGLDDSALRAATDALHACRDAWAERPTVPRDAAAELVDAYAGLDGIADAYDEPVRLRIREAARTLADLSLEAVAGSPGGDEARDPDAEALARAWQAFRAGLDGDGPGFDQDAYQRLTEALERGAAAWEGREEIPRTGAAVLFALFPATAQAAERREGEEREQLGDAAYALQDLAYACVG